MKNRNVDASYKHTYGKYRTIVYCLPLLQSIRPIIPTVHGKKRYERQADKT